MPYNHGVPLTELFGGVS